MNKPTIINQSIVLVDNIYYGELNNKTINLTEPYCFIDVNLVTLKTAFKKADFTILDGIRNPSNKNEFIFGNLVVTNTQIPPKLIIKNNVNEENTALLVKLTQNIIEEVKINDTIGGIGINYEVYIDNQDEKHNLVNILCNDKISKLNCRGINTTLPIKIDEALELTLNIADAKLNDKSIIYITANLHTKINQPSDIESVFKRLNYLDIFNEYLGKIFGVNYEK